jgi:hypothetical protein
VDGAQLMARIRTIKPEFWTDERIGEVSVSARLLLIGSLNFADDEGGLERSSKQLKAQIFPYDSIDCEPLVLELLRVGLLIEYEVADRKYLHIKGFSKHQKVENKAKPRIPLYDPSLITNITLTESSPSPHREPVEEKLSLRDQGREGIKEGIKEGNTELAKPVEPERSTAVTKPPNPKAAQIAESTAKVFEHWRAVHNHPRAALDDKRRKLIRTALEHYSEADLCQSLSGYLNSPHHMGQNDRATMYTDIELLLRDSGQIDNGLKFYAQPPRTDLSAKTRSNVAAIAEWKPPELRNAGQ